MPTTATSIEIQRSLKPLFDRAERERLWFFSPYQQLWFSPGNLRQQQEAGNFRWGSANWELRDPRERVRQLREEGKALLKKADALEQDDQATPVVVKEATAAPRVEEIRQRWGSSREDFDWSLHGSALRGERAVKDIRALLDLLSSLSTEAAQLRQERDDLKARLESREDAWTESLRIVRSNHEAQLQRCREAAFRAGWDAYAESQTESGPWRDVDEAWAALAERTPKKED
jgi:hypothetical protein